jgi:hypothetical protein
MKRKMTRLARGGKCAMGRWGDGEVGREVARDSEAKRLARPRMPKPLAKDLRDWRLERGMGVSGLNSKRAAETQRAQRTEKRFVLICCFAFFASLRRIYSLIYVEEFVGAE